MLFLHKSAKTVLQTAVFFTFIFLGVLWIAPATRAYTHSMSMEVGGSYEELIDGMSFSGTANGKIEIFDPEDSYIMGYEVTVDGVTATHLDGLYTQEPVYFSFDTSEYSDGNHILRVYVTLTELQSFETSAQIQFQNTPPTYTINVITTDEDGDTFEVHDGVILVGNQWVSITTFKNGIPITMTFVHVVCGDHWSYSNTELSEVQFSLDTNDFDDGTYDFNVTATIEGRDYEFTARVVVQNRNPVLLGLAFACFGLAALVLLLHIRQSKKRTVVAILRATRGTGGLTAGSETMRVNAVKNSATPSRASKPASFKSLPKTTAPGTSVIRKGWKNFVPLPALVVILAILLGWLFMTPETAFTTAFGAWFAYPLPHYALVIALGFSLISAWKWRTTAGTAIGAILYVILVLGSIFALANTIIGAGVGTLLEGGGADLTAGSFLIVIGTTMLSWLATPPPAAVLATRFARWQGRVPGYPGK